MIEWLIQSSAAHPDLARGVAPAGLLSPDEQRRLLAMPFEKRRGDWLLGRWTAKRLLQSHIARRGGGAPPLDSMCILSDPDGAPRVTGAVPGDLQLSISHCNSRAFCALADEAGLAIGADIERVAPRGPEFAEDYFTAHERAQLRAAPPAAHDTLVTLIWSAKEAALKALRLGLTVDTRSVSIELGPAPGVRGAWAPLSVSTALPQAGGRALSGWWQVRGEYVLTLALLLLPSLRLRSGQAAAPYQDREPRRSQIDRFSFPLVERKTKTREDRIPC